MICGGCSHSSSQCQHSFHFKIANLMRISSPATIQRAASCEQNLSEVPVTPLDQPKKEQI